MRLTLPMLVALAAALAGCDTAAPPRLSAPEPLPSPAAPGSGEPRLAAATSGDVWMTWFEPQAAGGHALRIARLDGRGWSVPVTIAAGDSFFVNWADFPALVALDARRLAVSYPWRVGDDPYAYDVRIRQSHDGGASWGEEVRPHRDGTETEHGFVTLLAEGNALRAVWLDGRNFAASGGHDGHGHGAGAEMTLRTAVIAADGALSGEALLDPRVCECCATAGAVTVSGTWIAYRDRSEEEVRDIALVRYTDGAWSEPEPLHDDGWRIHGCPVNGPAMTSDGRDAAIAWYTQARDTAAVYVAFARGGRGFAAPRRVDDGRPLGRTGVAMLDDGAAVVSWMEMAADTAEVRLRIVRADGRAEAPLTLARNSPRRASGFPQIVASRGRLVCAWTESGDPAQVRVAAVPLRR